MLEFRDLPQFFANHLRGTNGYCALEHNHFVSFSGLRDRGHDKQGRPEIGTAICGLWSFDSNKNHVAAFDRSLKFGREGETWAVLLDQVFKARFVNRNFAVIEQGDLAVIFIHANNAMPCVSEADSCDEPNIACSDHRDFHNLFPWPHCLFGKST